MQAVAEEYFSSAAEVCNFMPSELSYSLPERLGSAWVFWSRHDNEMQSILRSFCPSVDSCASRNKAIKEKIKVFLEHLEGLSLSYSLIQFWGPVSIGGKTYLSTADQPFALGELVRNLCSYRRLCLESVLIPVEGEEQNLGPPGRAFRNGLPEFCSDICWYISKEYPQHDRALELGIVGCVTLPLFEFVGQQCIGVLEIVSRRRLYCIGMLKVVIAQDNCIIGWFGYQLKNMHMKCGVHQFDDHILDSEATDKALAIVKNIFWRHELPLSQLWATNTNGEYISRIFNLPIGTYYRGNELLYVRVGQGVIGKAFSSRSACFCKDISNLSISLYPLVPLARKLELSGCFGICLKSSRGNYFYILEFFLPRWISFEDSRTFVSQLIKEIKNDIEESKDCPLEKLEERLFVEVMDDPRGQIEHDSFEVCTFTQDSVCAHPGGSKMMGHEYFGDKNGARNDSSDVVGSTLNLESSVDYDTKISGRNIITRMNSDVGAQTIGQLKTLDAEYGITSRVLQQHSGNKLEEVAKTLGVSRSTLKRICRKHNINRWPPRSKRPTGSCIQQEDFINPGEQKNDAHTIPSTTMIQEASSMLVKAMCGAEIFMFQLSVSAKMKDLEQELTRRLSPSLENFKIKYLDDEDEWVSLACDEDLKLCVNTFKSQGKTTVRMLLIS